MDLKYTKKRSGRAELVLKCTKKEQINIAELDLLDISAGSSIPEGLLRVTEKDLPHFRVAYDVSSCFRLKEYYSRSTFSQEEVLELAAQTVRTFLEMEAKRLTLQKLVMNTEYVFYNYKKQQMQFVFCPLQNNYAPKENEDVLRLIREIVTGAAVPPAEPSENRLQEFLNWLSVRKKATVSEIGEYLQVPPIRYTQDAIGIPVTTGTTYPGRKPVGSSPAGAKLPVPPIPAAASAPQSMPVPPPAPAPAIATPGDTCDAVAMQIPAPAPQNAYAYVPPVSAAPPAPAAAVPQSAPVFPAPAAAAAPQPVPAPPAPAVPPITPAPAVATVAISQPSQTTPPIAAVHAAPPAERRMPEFKWEARSASAQGEQLPAPQTGGIQIPGDTIDPPVQSGIAIPGDTVAADYAPMIRTGVILHPLTSAEYRINGMLTSIGRDGVDGYGRPVKPDLAITTDRGVSKIHAIILQENGYFYITDAAGKGNTFVNDQPISCGVNPDGTLNGQWTPLSDGTTIRLAQQGFVFHIR